MMMAVMMEGKVRVVSDDSGGERGGIRYVRMTSPSSNMSLKVSGGIQ